MENEQTDKIGHYAKLFREIRVQVDSDQAAAAVLCEVAKDSRSAQIREERRNGNGNGQDGPATPKQTRYLKRLGVEAPEGLTKADASQLIDEVLAK